MTKPHEHEQWQIRETDPGKYHCAACGTPTLKDGKPLPVAELRKYADRLYDDMLDDYFTKVDDWAQRQGIRDSLVMAAVEDIAGLGDEYADWAEDNH